jgi:hypothetical protein
MLPSMVVMFGPWLVLLRLMNHHDGPRYGLRLFLPVFLGGFVAGWLVWSLGIPRWRLWAYRSVGSVAELKRVAMQRGLIWPDGSLWERTELISSRERALLRQLEAERP